jgi:hypothetical protein
MSINQQTPQSDIFTELSEQRLFADVCNALYERELMFLAMQNSGQPSLLKRRLGGLTHHVKKAAEYLVANPTPLGVDAHNGSWQFKQALKCPAKNQSPQATQTWFEQKTTVGLPVSVRIKYHDHEHLELDCVDKIDTKNQTLHLNRFGWFSFDGTFIDDDTMHSEANISEVVLIKPCKKTMTAACSGHCWNHKGKLSPRALSLRELLLSTLINWKTFTYSGKPQFI